MNIIKKIFLGLSIIFPFVLQGQTFQFFDKYAKWSGSKLYPKSTCWFGDSAHPWNVYVSRSSSIPYSDSSGLLGGQALAYTLNDSINQRANRYLRLFDGSGALKCSTLIHEADTSLYSLNSGQLQTRDTSYLFARIRDSVNAIFTNGDATFSAASTKDTIVNTAFTTSSRFYIIMRDSTWAGHFGIIVKEDTLIINSDAAEALKPYTWFKIK
jgi:hypothetical protein